MDIRSINATQKYSALREATQPAPTADDAGKVAGHVAAYFGSSLQKGVGPSMAATAGDSDPHALVQALAQTELAVEAAVTVRNKVVEAYQEILRMPV